MNQIQITHSSMITGNQELTHQLQTSNLEIGRLQTEVFVSAKFGYAIINLPRVETHIIFEI